MQKETLPEVWPSGNTFELVTYGGLVTPSQLPQRPPATHQVENKDPHVTLNEPVKSDLFVRSASMHVPGPLRVQHSHAVAANAASLVEVVGWVARPLVLIVTHTLITGGLAVEGQVNITSRLVAGIWW